MLSSGRKVESTDEASEVFSIAVDVLEELRVEVVLVIELGDLGLVIANHGAILMPLLPSQSLEEFHLVLAVSRLGCLLSLGEVEGEGEELLSVGGGQSELVDVGLVPIERCVGGGEELFVGSIVLAGSLDLVDKSLELDRVSTSSLNSGWVTERDVFKTVDLTEVPEPGIEIGSCTLDLEHLLQVGVLPNVPHHLVEQLRLGEWVRGVGGEVIGVFLLLGHVRARLGLLVVETEAAHKVGLRYHNFMSSSDVLLTRGEAEQSGGQLGASIVEKREHTDLSDVAKPRLAEDTDAISELTLDGSSLVSSDTTAEGTPHGFSTPDSHNLVDLFSVSTVISVRVLDARDQ